MKKLLATLFILVMVLFVQAQAQSSTAYVYLQGTWVSQAGDPSVTVVINSPYVEIGQVLANVTYGGSTTCTTDLYRQGENADTVMLQEYVVSGTCANGASVSLRHDAATDTLWWQSGQDSRQLYRLNANTDVFSHGMASTSSNLGIGPDGTVCECAPRPLEAFLTTDTTTTPPVDMQAQETTVSPAQQLLQQVPVSNEATPMPVAEPTPPSAEK
ncbi:MAG: hypothetical protein R2865_17905 [Deinococcales bacterium]